MRNITLRCPIARCTKIILCTLISFMLQSCGDTIIPDEQEYAINMSASSALMSTSRALVTDNTTLQETALGVYGYKEVNSNKTMVFNNTELTYTANKGWDYSFTKYWDRTANYSFVAFSPYKATHRYDNHTLTISDIPYWQVIDNDVVDYLVANSSGSAESYLSSDSKSVNFNFSHILSQLVINITKDEKLKDTEYKLKQVDYLNVPRGNDATATYTLSQEGSATLSAITLLEEKGTLTQYSNANGQVVTTGTGNISLPHLVVPFTLTNSKQVQVKVTYTVAGTERNKTVDTGITQLEAGKRYELTLTFKGAEIVPTLAVKNWVEANVDEDDKYNW